MSCLVRVAEWLLSSVSSRRRFDTHSPHPLYHRPPIIIMQELLFGKVYSPRPIVVAAASIVACPLIWNIVARNEYKNHTLSRLLGSPRRGCYLLATWIFTSSLYRDVLFTKAVMMNNDSVLTNDSNTKGYVAAAGKALTGMGAVLVVSSMYRLGVTGTYLGDYFGFLMSARVSGFPFNVCSDPMYAGATMQFVGLALAANSHVGVTLSGLVAAVYYVATKWFEGPFTSYIYSNRAAAEEAAASRAKPSLAL